MIKLHSNDQNQKYQEKSSQLTNHDTSNSDYSSQRNPHRLTTVKSSTSLSVLQDLRQYIK